MRSVMKYASIGLMLVVGEVAGHGYMLSPRSRNYVAFDDGKYWPLLAGDPKKEDCPHCLNLGGTLARCGLTADRNYDDPKDALGGALSSNPQAIYQDGDEITIDVILTAHHKGHFVYKACAVQEGETASQTCFDANPLEFIQDNLYGAPKDTNYTGRAYIAPSSHPDAVYESSGVYGQRFSHTFKLPTGLSGDLVLIQWHYMTANSCKYAGYDAYPFPDPSWAALNLGSCEPVPEDGNGVPEQFWNCAEVTIQSSGPPSTTSPPSQAPAAATPPPSGIAATPQPTPTPTVVSTTSTPSPTPPTSGSPNVMCCSNGQTALKSFDSCTKFYHCVNGVVTGSPIACPAGTLFDESGQNCNHANAVTCGTEDCPSSGPTSTPTTASRCGPTWGEAQAICSDPCGTNIDCPSGQYCWGGITCSQRRALRGEA